MRRCLFLVPLTLAGCLPIQGPEKTAQVSSQFFDAAPATRTARAPLPPADDTVCVRVEFVGRKVVTSNPHIGMQPFFATIRAQEPEVFHVDQRIVYITDGLVKQLPSEADLAAVLSFELARMVAEREARIKQDLKQAEPRPPILVPMGNSGQQPTGDMVSTVEVARYDQQRQAHRQPAARPKPDQLARDYLEKAGFQRVDLDRVQPALQAAARNSALERQLRGFAPTGNWAP